MKDYINQVLQLIRKPPMESQSQPSQNNRQKQQQTHLDNPNNVTFSAQVVKQSAGQPQQYVSLSPLRTSIELAKAPGQALGSLAPNNNTAIHAAVTPLIPTTAAPIPQTTSDNKKPNISQSKLLNYYTDPIMHIDYDRIRYPKHSDAIFD